MAIKGPTQQLPPRDELLRRATQGRPLRDPAPTEQVPERPGASGVDSGERLQAMQGVVGHQQHRPPLGNSGLSGPRNLGPATRMELEAQLGGDLAERTRAQFTNFDLQNWEQLQSGRVDMRDAAARAGTPDGVQESYDYYYNKAEANDWGTVRVLERQVGDDPIYLVATTTDGSDAYMELFDRDGAPLGSGQQIEGQPTDWDAIQGACRHHLDQYG